jgi:hypothetical protein
MLFHQRKAVATEGEVLLSKMQEARAMALKIQRATDQAQALSAEQAADINRNAQNINRLLAN